MENVLKVSTGNTGTPMCEGVETVRWMHMVSTTVWWCARPISDAVAAPIGDSGNPSIQWLVCIVGPMSFGRTAHPHAMGT